jgi:hypothetical protein
LDSSFEDAPFDGKSDPVTLVVFEKNKENKKKTLTLCLNLRIRLTIAPLESIVFH